MAGVVLFFLAVTGMDAAIGLPSACRFTFDSNVPADLWINGVNLGPMPITLSQAEMKKQCLPDFEDYVTSFGTMARTAASYKPEADVRDGGSGSRSDRGWQFNIWQSSKVPDILILFRAYLLVDGKPVPFAGGFRVRKASGFGEDHSLNVDATRGWGSTITFKIHFEVEKVQLAREPDPAAKATRAERARAAFDRPRELDLSADTQRQVIVDREPGQYLGHPTTVLLADGKTILCAYPKGHGRGPIVMKRSQDGGHTWGPRLDLPKSFASSAETPTLHRMVDPSGGERVILFSGLYPIRRAISEDAGVTWSELEPIGEFGGIVAMSSVVRIQEGAYAAFFHDDGRFIHQGGAALGTFTLYQTVSMDGGVSWNAPRAIWSGSEVHLCEPGAIRDRHGRTLALLLRENRRVKNSHIMLSTDEARTWSAPRELSWALTGDRHVAVDEGAGCLFISFRDMGKDSPTYGDWIVWVGGFDGIALGQNGQYRVRLMDNRDGTDCGYAGLEVLPDHSFVATSYGHWTAGEEPYIVSVHFSRKELDDLAYPSKK